MIIRGVQITMANKTTTGAIEDSFSQRHILDIEPAIAAFVTAPSCLGIFHNASTACYSFVFQEAYESSPSSITNLSCPEAIIHHTFDVQLLDSDNGIFVCDFPAQLVQEVSPLICNFDVLFVQSENSFSSVTASFLLSAQSSVQEFEFLFGFDKEVRICNLLSVGKCSKAFQSDINADLFSRRMNDFSVGQFAGEDSKPLSSFVLFDCQSLNFSFGDSVKNDWKISNLAQLQPFVGENFESGLWKSYAIDSALETRKSFFFAGLVLDSAKEVLKSFVNPVRNILCDLRMNLKSSFYDVVVVKFVERNIAKLVGIDGKSKKLIIDCLASLERINQSNFLLARRIQTIFIHLNDHRGGYYV